MTTLIAVYNSDGCVGRCDARCYNAVSDYCDCICGGMNHGSGREKAIDNTRDWILDGDTLEQFAERHGLEPESLKVAGQSDLFPYGNEPTTKQKRRAARQAARAARK